VIAPFIRQMNSLTEPAMRGLSFAHCLGDLATGRAALASDWSPEQIAGRLKLEKQPTVSHECIYLYIYADKRRSGTLHQHLRSQKKQRSVL